MHTLIEFLTRARSTLVDDTTKWRSVESLYHKLLWCAICCLKSTFYTSTLGIYMRYTFLVRYSLFTQLTTLHRFVIARSVLSTTS